MKGIFFLFLLLSMNTLCTHKVKRQGFIGELVSNVPDHIYLNLPGGCKLYFQDFIYQEYYVDSFVSDHSGANEIAHFYFSDSKKISIEYDLINMARDTSLKRLKAMIQLNIEKLLAENPNRDESKVFTAITVLNGKVVGVIKYDDVNRIVVFYCGMYRIKLFIEGTTDSEEADDILNSIHID
jgi:hypothetical protein